MYKHTIVSEKLESKENEYKNKKRQYMSVYSILVIKFESDRRPIALGAETGAAAPGDCNSARRWSAAAEVVATHVGRGAQSVDVRRTLCD